MAAKPTRANFFKISTERDVSVRSGMLVFITVLILLIGLSAEASGVSGAIVASTGVVVAATTPLFAIFLGQLADYSVSVRLQLFNYRKEKEIGDAVGPISFTEKGRKEEEEAMEFVESMIEKYSALEQSLRSSNGRLISTQSWIIAASALVASFAGYARNYLMCGSITCSS